jgi:hypothetical protein
MLVIQVVILAFSLYVLARTFLRFRNGIIDIAEWILWSLFWIAVAVFVMVPSATQWFAHLMGVGRGADAVLYVGMISISYAFFRVYLRMRDVDQQVTQLVRKLALNEAQNESKPMDSGERS